MVLDIGCGSRKIEPGAIGIDISPDSAADHVWDLDQFPWPLAGDQFTRIHMSHVIEHLDDPMRAMAEVYRVARDGADVFIVTPHFSSHNSYVDPTHKRHLAAGSFAYLTGKDFPSFRGAPFRFEIVGVELTFGGNLLLGAMAPGDSVLQRATAFVERVHAAAALHAAAATGVAG